MEYGMSGEGAASRTTRVRSPDHHPPHPRLGRRLPVCPWPVPGLGCSGRVPARRVGPASRNHEDFVTPLHQAGREAGQLARQHRNPGRGSPGQPGVRDPLLVGRAGHPPRPRRSRESRSGPGQGPPAAPGQRCGHHPASARPDPPAPAGNPRGHRPRRVPRLRHPADDLRARRRHADLRRDPAPARSRHHPLRHRDPVTLPPARTPAPTAPATSSAGTPTATSTAWCRSRTHVAWLPSCPTRVWKSSPMLATSSSGPTSRSALAPSLNLSWSTSDGFPEVVS